MPRSGDPELRVSEQKPESRFNPNARESQSLPFLSSAAPAQNVLGDSMWSQQFMEKVAVTIKQGFALPQKELTVFNGDPLEYCSFITSFQNSIEANATSERKKLMYLLQYTSDPLKSWKDTQDLPMQQVERFWATETIGVETESKACTSMEDKKALRTMEQSVKLQDGHYQRALQFACGNSLVCDGMEEARKLAFGGAERKKTVSLDGILFQKSGVISGGVSDLKAKARRWDEKQVDGLKRKRDSLLSELKELSKHRRKEPELQNLRSQIDGLEHRLRYSTKDKETTPKRERLLISMATRSEEITNTEKRMNRVEDQVFRAFCEQINVDNIRQYEEKQLKAQQERAQRRLEFSNQESRLMNQLDYERGRDTKAQLRKLEESMAADNVEIEKLRGEEKDKLKIIERETSELEKLRLEKSAKRAEIDQKDLEIKEVKKSLMHFMRDVTTLQKQLTAMETQLEQKRADRHSLLKSCKMEDIFLPFKKGGMNDIDLGETSSSQQESSSQDQAEPLSMDIDSTSTQGAKITYEKEANLVIDYFSLSRNLKQVHLKPKN
ncbi:Structural maintenance of chromosomes protein 1A [Acropora cervicornis]|uniref:Structural maintenance of chromosomes protein 1A n=1 Tax=Acropora cervicornis TaxID=6130 RepID=A0AAD9UU81_ACRCE|nr:Structural maintenance of chromosomes protein 1A [Acropora cervicornis]